MLLNMFWCGVFVGDHSPSVFVASFSGASFLQKIQIKKPSLKIQRRHKSPLYRGATLVAGTIIPASLFPSNAGLRVPPYCAFQEDFSQTLFPGHVAAGLPLCSGSLMVYAQILLLFIEFSGIIYSLFSLVKHFVYIAGRNWLP